MGMIIAGIEKKEIYVKLNSVNRKSKSDLEKEAFEKVNKRLETRMLNGNFEKMMTFKESDSIEKLYIYCKKNLYIVTQKRIGKNVIPIIEKIETYKRVIK